MKKLITVMAFGLVLGSAGALELGNIGMMQTIVQAGLGLALLFLMYRKEIRNGKNDN